MSVQPAPEIDLDDDGRTVTLRADLRAATAIENMPGGIAGAYEGLLSQSFTTIRAVILATATDRRDGQAVLAAIASKPLSSFLSDAQAACLAVLAATLTTGDDDANDASSHGSNDGMSGGEMPLRKYFQTLYGYGTGWLGWSSADTWAASPIEIESAFAAHIDRLVKLTPGASSTEATPEASASNSYNAKRLREIEEQGFDPAFDRHGLRKLKAMS
ncbi:hypothetical protein MU516_07030 [Paracoccus sp. YLB-12]|uniref:Tail assembly chaperone n=1 Tax=Paracoccus maritimus TaxID=2933292 RepID=A0ABT2K7W1_9RHOB|nr:hypothetical protein [Paracoccus sp. YLB-12]MCT4332619.1 hypothetical protein [Paracoccus sp. YLB-12]